MKFLFYINLISFKEMNDKSIKEEPLVKTVSDLDQQKRAL